MTTLIQTGRARQTGVKFHKSFYRRGANTLRTSRYVGTEFLACPNCGENFIQGRERRKRDPLTKRLVVPEGPVLVTVRGEGGTEDFRLFRQLIEVKGGDHLRVAGRCMSCFSNVPVVVL